MQINNFKELIETVTPELESDDDFREDVQHALADYVNRAEQTATTVMTRGLGQDGLDINEAAKVIIGLLVSAVSQTIDVHGPIDVLALKSDALQQAIAASFKLGVGFAVLEGYVLPSPETEAQPE